MLSLTVTERQMMSGSTRSLNCCSLNRCRQVACCGLACWTDYGAVMPVWRILTIFSFLTDVCEALNVTVSPGPMVQYSEGDNATLYCHISQKRKTDNLLAVRWVFAASPAQEHLMIKMTKFGSVQYYGNYTHHFHKQRLHLLKEEHGTMYKFLILSLRQTDQGHYICKVQEIGKHRNKWTAWSNGTAATELRGERLLISSL